MKTNQKSTIPVFDSFNDSNIKVFALGGLGEVGKNMYCIECEDEIIVIDCGILFPDSNYGIDLVIPDFTYLINNYSKIKGLFITHGHEDHIGAIPYLLRDLKDIPIYANGIAIELIQQKARETLSIVNIHEYTHDSVFEFKHFTVSFFRTNHSIPDSHGIIIRTYLGYIVHTGDFKFDLTPVSYHTEYDKLTKVATSELGVLCLLSDSTNALVNRFSESETRISLSIKNIFDTLTGRIIVATFASNIYRIAHIIEASVSAGRKVCIFGKSMEKNVTIALENGYIDVPKTSFVSAGDLKHITKDKITIIATGSQGESLAALSRIAFGVHKYVTIEEDDTVIFSSSAIPGNQDSINRIINQLYKSGANVITNSSMNDTHASGHGGKTELQFMLALTKPKYFMPIHGDYTMQKQHVELAVATGIPRENCFILKNGNVLTFSPKKVFSLYNVFTDNTFVDENDNTIASSIIFERRTLSDEGLICIIYSMDKKHKLVNSPNIVTRGFIFMKNSDSLMREIKQNAESVYNNYISNYTRFNEADIKASIINCVSYFVNMKTERKPMIIPIFMEC